jgi:cobalt-zinc-cadmium resistance protein CzcA
LQIGVGIAIVNKAQKAKIAASKIQENILENQYDLKASYLQNQYSKQLAAYSNNAAIVKYIEETGLKNALLINQTAAKQFANGEINYLDFVMLTNQAISIESKYIEMVKALNESIIEINFLTSK